MISTIKKEKGFTLIELIVVILLIGIFLTFAVPRLKTDFMQDNTKKTIRWIISKINVLKKDAVFNKKQYALHIGIDSNRLWITDDSMSKETIENMEQKGYEIPSDIKVIDVQYPDTGKIEYGTATISFYKKGYSDKAIIHLEDDDQQIVSLLVEPFLDKVKLYETYAGFDD